MKKRSRRGFTLAELLVVVAIIGVLVAISIPIFSAQIHKAEVATDWANIRAYYSEIQADYISTGNFNTKVPDLYQDGNMERREIDFLDGHKVKLKTGYFAVIWISKENSFPEERGYQVKYYCNDCKTDWDKHKNTCVLTLGAGI